MDAGPLRQDLRGYRKKRDRGAFAELSRLTGSTVKEATISRIAGEQAAVTFETWLALHLAAPDEIRKPVGLEEHVPRLKEGHGLLPLDPGEPPPNERELAMLLQVLRTTRGGAQSDTEEDRRTLKSSGGAHKRA